MKILVTGATGFIGQNLIPFLLTGGHDIIATSPSKEKAKKFCWLKDVHYVEADLSQNIENPFEYFSKPETLIHLAWQGLPNYSELYHYENNFFNDYRFLKNITECGLKNLLVTGTCFEYGIKYGPLAEEIETSPQNPYALAKDTLRKCLFQLQKQLDFNLTWIRLFYMYGKGQNEKSLFPQLERAIETGEPSFKMSQGEQLRDYLPVKTVAESIVQLALQRANFGIVNCCSGNPVSVRSLVEKRINEKGSNIKLDLGAYPYSKHEAMAFWGDNAKLNQLVSDIR